MDITENAKYEQFDSLRIQSSESTACSEGGVRGKVFASERLFGS